MLPLQSILPTRFVPMATIGLIGMNAAVFLVHRWAGPIGGDGSIVGIALSPFTHAGAAIFVVHVLYLWIFGDNVEDQLGRLRFGSLYAGCGLVAALVAIALGGEPIARAGGAVSGVLGASIAFYPRSRVLLLVPVPLTLHELPAGILVGLWFVTHALSLSATPDTVATDAIVHGLTAHAAGFGAGALLGLALRQRRRTRVDWWSVDCW